VQARRAGRLRLAHGAELDRAGRGEAAGPARAGGLHGARFAGTVRKDGPPLRYILPAGVLD